MVAFFTTAISAGTGRHRPVLRTPDFERACLLSLIGLFSGAVSFTLTKVAVVILLVNLLHPPPWHSRLLWVLVSGNVLFILCVGALFFLQCSPPKALWTVDIEHNCWDPAVANSVVVAGSGMNCFFFPLPRSHLSFSLKVAGPFGRLTYPARS